MKKIKVLHVLTVFNRGGLETMLMNYFRKFNREEFELYFLVHRENGDYEDEILNNGGTIYRVRSLSFSVVNFMEYQKELDEFFKIHHFDIVHVHTNSFGYFPLKYAKKHGTKVRIIHSHISALKDDWRKLILGKVLNRKIPSVANTLFACGINAGKWMFGKRPFMVIPNAIKEGDFRFDESKRKAIRACLIQKESLCIVNVARLQPQKNHLFLLEVFSELVKIHPDAYLFLVGEGELKGDIESRIRTLHLSDKVTLLGVRADVPELMQAMDLFLFPSLFEGLPVSLVEAQASGIRCVISDGISAESILVDENVKVISLKKSPSFWAKEILDFASYQRRDTSSIIKEKGYDIADAVKKLEEQYRKLLSDASSEG